MKEKENKGRKALLAIAVVVAGVATYGCSQSTVAYDGRSDIDRRTRAEKISRFGHSYIYLRTEGQWGPTFLHDPDCLCLKGGAK